MERDFKCLSLESLLNHEVLKMLKLCFCRYHAQHKSWMSGELFEDWVFELDRKFAVSKRKIALIIDNCTAHPHVENLKWVELIFLPPNTASHTQAMDQGIIQALKAKYRLLAVRKLTLTLEKKEPIPKFSILSAIYMLKKHGMLSRTRHSLTASENRGSQRRMLKSRWMTKRILLKG